jgi:phosphoglycerate dehydrogenase-like enzyme
VIHLDDQSTLDELDQILPSADIVISTVPDTSRTRGIFDKTRLQRFKQEAVFMNFGRGSVVDENALIEILMQKRIRGAVIDVTMDEPLPENHGLWTCPNTIITQHSGGGTADEVPRKIEWFSDNLKRFRNGETLQGMVDFERGY